MYILTDTKLFKACSSAHKHCQHLVQDGSLRNWRKNCRG